MLRGMSRADMNFVNSYIEHQGLDMAMQYGPFNEVKSETFHKLRRDYLKARKELIGYINCKEC